MALRPEQYYASPDPKQLVKFVRPDSGMNIDPEKLSVDLLRGDDRSSLRFPITGDASLVFRYNGKPGYVASFHDDGDELVLRQLQGTKPEGYRLVTGLYIVPLVCDELLSIASHPDSPYASLAIPSLLAIVGITDAVEKAFSRYQQAVSYLRMEELPHERKYRKTLR